jgi:hypothetical protein
MNRNYPPYNPHSPRASSPPGKTATRWWRPLTNRWGIFGIIIFIGLVMSLIENSARWYAGQSQQTPTVNVPNPTR